MLFDTQFEFLNHHQSTPIQTLPLAGEGVGYRGGTAFTSGGELKTPFVPKKI